MTQIASRRSGHRLAVPFRPVHDAGRMASRPPSIADVARDPRWLAHRYDPGHDAVHFRVTPREAHRGATFITDDYLPPVDAPIVLRRADAVAAAPEPAPIQFIFHSAFCCSTLLARALDIEGTSMGLKEPMILNDLSGWAHRGASARDVAQVLNDALTLLARPFAPGETSIVKPSNVANAMAPAMLAMRPGARALLLHAPLRDYLNSIARKGMDGRLWVRDLLVKLLKDRLIDLGFSGEDYLRHSDLQAAAVGWLAQHALFARIIESHGTVRVRSLSSDLVTAQPRKVLEALAKLFELSLDERVLDMVVAGPAFTRHSKHDGEFGSSERLAQQRDAARLHGDEIEKVAIWAEAVAANAGVPMDLPAPLLG